MRNKSARLTILLPPQSKQEFAALCAQLGLVPSQVMRDLIDGFIERDDSEPLLAPRRRHPPPRRRG